MLATDIHGASFLMQSPHYTYHDKAIDIQRDTYTYVHTYLGAPQQIRPLWKQNTFEFLKCSHEVHLRHPARHTGYSIMSSLPFHILSAKDHFLVV